MLPSDYSQDGNLRRGCIQAQAKDGSKCRSLGEAEELNQSLVTSIVFGLISGDSTGNLIIYKAKNEIVEDLSLTLSEVKKKNIYILTESYGKG